MPIIVSLVALAVATFIGLIPVFQQNRSSNVTEAPDLSDFETRLAALEAAVAAQADGTGGAAGAAAEEIPPNAGNVRLRQEIDFINKGLLNQTGRVSRVIDRLDTVVSPDGAPIVSERIRAELTLINRGLANLTRRVNELDDRLDALGSAATDIDRLQKQMSNVDTALLRVAGSMRELKGGGASAPDTSAPDTSVADIDRLQKQMANVDKALLRLAGAVRGGAVAPSEPNTSAADIDRLQKQMANVDKALLRLAGSVRALKKSGGSAEAADPALDPKVLEEIQLKLVEILQVIEG